MKRGSRHTFQQCAADSSASLIKESDLQRIRKGPADLDPLIVETTNVSTPLCLHPSENGHGHEPFSQPGLNRIANQMDNRSRGRGCLSHVPLEPQQN